MLNNCSGVNNMQVSLKKKRARLGFILKPLKTVHDSSVSGLGLSWPVPHCLYKKMTCTCFPQAIAHNNSMCISDFYIFIFDNDVYLLTMIAFVYAPIV